MANDVEYKLSLNDKFSKPLKDADKSVSSFEGTVKRVGAVLLGWEAVKFGANIGKQIISLGAQAESTEVAFSTMLDSKMAGKGLINQLNELATVTPFTASSIKNSAKQLLAYGFSAEEIIPTINNLGDIASGVGMDKLPNLTLALGQVRAASKLTGMELRQFTEAGVPMLEYLSKVTGKSIAQVQKNISEGKISYQMVLQALNLATSEGGKFFNMMKKQSQTTEGLWSTFEDKVELTATALGTRLNPASKSVVKGLISMGDAMLRYVRISPAEEIDRERNNVRALASELTSTNTPLQRRNEIYDYLKKEHPEIIAGISKENVETEKLAENVAKYNQNALNRITIAKMTEKEKDEMDDLAKVQDRLAEARAKMYELIARVSPKIAMSAQTDAEKANEVQKLLLKNIGYEREQYKQQQANASASEKILNTKAADQALTSQNQQDLAALLKIADDYNAALAKNNKLQGNVNSIQRRNAYLKKMFGITDMDNKLTAKTTVTADKNLEDSMTTLKSAAPKTFNINITKLIETFNVNTTTLKDGVADIKSQVTNAIAEALADVKAQTNA